MSTQRFAANTKFQWKDNLFRIVRLRAGDKVEIEDMSLGVPSIVNIHELETSYLAMELKFLRDESITSATQTQSSNVDLSSFPDHLADIARYRLGVIRQFIDLAPNKRNEAIRAYVDSEKQTQASVGVRKLASSLSAASIKRWIKSYQRSQGDVRSLVPNTKRRGGQTSQECIPQ